MEARGGMDVGRRPQSRGMRGDVVTNNHLDGLNVVGTTAYPMEMMERVEVLTSSPPSRQWLAARQSGKEGDSYRVQACT